MTHDSKYEAQMDMLNHPSVELVGFSYDTKINDPSVTRKDPIVPYGGNPHLYHVYYRFKPKPGEKPSLKHLHLHHCSLARLPSHINRLDFLHQGSGQMINNFVEKHLKGIKDYCKMYTTNWFNEIRN